MKKTRKIWIILCFSLSIAILIGGVSFVSYLLSDAKLDDSKLPFAAGNIKIYDSFGNLIEDENYVKSSDISENIKNAFIAIEDKRFYQHKGVDPYRIGGAIFSNIKSGGYVQGASTITCQLVKNTHLSNEKTFKRKLQEAKIAVEVEKKYDKNQIMEMYLNVLYFGKGIYGIKNACLSIFGKHPKDISVAEAAMLAATVANPAKYSPLSHANNNRKRADLVLSLMKKQGFIRNEEIKVSDIVINNENFHNNSVKNCRNSILFEASQKIGKPISYLIKNKCVIHSYIEPSLQAAAENAIDQKEFDAICKSGKTADKHILIANNRTHGISAYASNDAKTAFSASGQPGSTIKPFVYAAAIEQGKLLPGSQFSDKRETFGEYSPKNYGDAYVGWISASKALASSSNTIAVKILNETGVDYVYNYIKNCGFSLTEKDKNLALALGGTTFGSNMIQIGEGYQTFSNGGIRNELTFIKKITDRSGKTIYKNKNDSIKAISFQASYFIRKMLKETVESGTASQLSYLGIDVCAKTGTVAKGDGNSDAWIAGYTPDHTFVCHYGSTGKDCMNNSATGGNHAAKTIRFALREIYSDKKPGRFVDPIGIHKIKVNSYLKNERHVLIPYSEFPFGDFEEIETWNGFSFERLEKESVYLSDLSISESGEITFSRIDGVYYKVKINGKKCKDKGLSFQAEIKRSGVAKLEIECSANGRVLFTKRKWITFSR